MKTIIKLAAASALALSLAACQSAPSKTAADVDMAMKAATSANKAVKKVGYEWRDTGKILKQAKKAKDKKDFDKAYSLAKKAENQAKNAMAQYKENKNAGPRF